MPGPFTFPVSIALPFEPGRVSPSYPSGSPFTSLNAQDAIEEALTRAVSNDRYLVLSSYGGNANTGRYLEFFPSQGSDVSPIFNSASSKILTITLQTTSATATCNLGIFDLNVSSVTPVYTVVMSAVKRVEYTGTPSIPLASLSSNALLALRVTSGSINSPTCQLIFSAAT